ncbi:MAG: DUF2911 domain-containing protein [Bacteroidota bacterium]
MNTKKTINLLLLCFFFTVSVTAQIDTPAPSPAGAVSSTVGLTEVSVEYYRPGKKGRKIFGDGSDFLVPYGQIWRTGANAGTILSLSTDAKIGDTEVKAGEYQIVSKPGADTWNIMLITEMIGGNMSKYNEDIVAATINVKPMKTKNTVERMTFQIAEISEDNTKATIQFCWDNLSFEIPIEVSFHESVMKDIAAKTQVNPQNYVAAANYYLTTGENLEQALEWMNAYLAVGKNSGQFWNVHTKARILAAMGNKKEAIATAKDSMKKAENWESGDFGYIKRNQDLIDSLN